VDDEDIETLSGEVCDVADENDTGDADGDST